MAVPPFNLDTSNPADNAAENVYPTNERAFRDNVRSYLGTEHDINSGHHGFPMLGTAARDSITNWPHGSLIYNTDLQVIQMNNGTDVSPSWVSAGASLKANYFSTSSSLSFTLPAANMVFFLIGAGGGGGGGTSDPSVPGGGGGGGSGAFQIYPIYGMVPGLTLTLTVGAAGAGGLVGAVGTAGGDTSIASGTQAIVSALAGGGGAGGASAGPNAGGAAGTCSGGVFGQSIPLDGRAGGNGYATPTVGLPGAGAISNNGYGPFGTGGIGGYADTATAIPGSEGATGLIVGVYYNF